MRKGIHPQMQWVSVVTEDGRLIISMMPKIHHIGQVYHLKAKRQMVETVGRIAKFRQRYGLAPSDAATPDPNHSPQKPPK